MEDLFAREQAAEQNVHTLLKNKDEPVLNILGALEEYRQLSTSATFANFGSDVEKRSAKLWAAHTETRKLLRRALSDLRHKTEPVSVRQVTKLYLQFVKDSQRFYREYISKLNSSFGGIPELEAAAHRVKNDKAVESLPLSSSIGYARAKALEQCHQSLIYLGDLSRYRTSDKLDRKPDYGPAIGYYGLACSLFPSSGLGHHQQAVIALEQRQHLRAIYHLYRALVVEQPHPNARNNLRLEFDKINTAWDRGELIRRGPPNDPDGPRQSLIGWYVRLHSMCNKGQISRGYEELEQEVLSQFASELQKHSIDNLFLRLILVNLAAQHVASEEFQEYQTEQHQQAFLQIFRFNLRTFTNLLRIFHSDLQSLDVLGSDEDDHLDLTTRLTSTNRRLLPCLRLYSRWILPTINLLDGLSTDSFLQDSINQFWTAYVRSIDLVITMFPIWDLENLPQVEYLLEEDTDTLGFKPLIDESRETDWYHEKTGGLKPRFSDNHVVRVSPDDEMLIRVKQFLEDALFLANDSPKAPIRIQGSQVIFNNSTEPTTPTVPIRETLIVANSETVNTSTKPSTSTIKTASHSTAMVPSKMNETPLDKGQNQDLPRSRQAELTRMVDDLVDDDENELSAHESSMLPVTPPQRTLVNPTIGIMGELSRSTIPESIPGSTSTPKNPLRPQQQLGSKTPGKTWISPATKTPKDLTPSHPMTFDSVSSLWDNMPTDELLSSAQFPSGLPTGTLGSPARMAPHVHSRGNSASSIRSGTSPNITLGALDRSWSTLESLPRPPIGSLNGTSAGGFGATQNALRASTGSPLLFGAGGGPWSNTNPQPNVSNSTPPNGQGG